MTAPPPPPPPPPPDDDSTVMTVAAILATSVSVDAAMAAMAAGGALLIGAGAYYTSSVRQAAMRAALGVVMGHPPGQDGFHGQAGRNIARTNMLRRAQFTVSAAQRLSQDISRAISAGQSVAAALLDGVARERRFYSQHLMAIWNRQKAASQADSTATTYGDLLGWHTVRDGKTSRECLAADGRNFHVGYMPLIGYPGAVHPHCRCQPGKPFAGAAILPSYGLDLRRAA